jgi:putative membrane protein
MSGRAVRYLPAIAAALAMAVLGAGNLAFAGDRGSHDRDSQRASGDRGHDGRGHHGDRHGSRGHYRVSAWDKQWLKMHIETNLFEIAGGQAALEKASSDEVRELGAHLVNDHTAALRQAVAVAEKVGVEVPKQPSPLQQWALRAVSQFSGPAFDRWFADLQVEGHRQAILLAEAEVAKGRNPKVRGLAAASLPVLKEHLEHALAVLESTR